MKISEGNDKIFMNKRNSICNFYKTFTSFKGKEESVKYSLVSKNATVFIRKNIESKNFFKIPVPERNFFGKNANNYSIWHTLLNSRRESEANFYYKTA